MSVTGPGLDCIGPSIEHGLDWDRARAKTKAGSGQWQGQARGRARAESQIQDKTGPELGQEHGQA